MVGSERAVVAAVWIREAGRRDGLGQPRMRFMGSWAGSEGGGALPMMGG